MYIGEKLSFYQTEHPCKAAIVYKDIVISYQELIHHIGLIQQFLTSKIGAEKRKRIALQLENEPAFIETFFASVMLGHSCSPLDPKWTKEEVNNVLERSKPDLIVTKEMYVEMIQGLPADIEGNAEEQDIFYIGFTSGSTGIPKGFQRNHLSWLDSFSGCQGAFKLTNQDVISAPGPLCHSLTLFAAIFAIHAGSTFILSEKFEPNEVLNTIRKHGVTTLFVVPTMLQAMLQIPKQEPSETVGKILSSGSKWLPEQKNRIKELFPNSECIEYYGASETSFITYLDEDAFCKYPSSVGKAFPTVNLSIRNDEGTVLPPNEIGLVYIRSNMIFSGYLEEDFHSKIEEISVGDLGFINEEGYLTLVGREKNKLISGGLNIFPEEIEAYLKKVEEIEEVVVVGIPDEYWGDRVVALIKWRNNCRLSSEALKSYCKEGLSTYKCPKNFYEVVDFPYTSSGKIARKELWNELKGWLGSEIQ